MEPEPIIETAEDVAALCRRYLLESFPELQLIDSAEIERIVTDPDPERTELNDLIGDLLQKHAMNTGGG
jgi:hypothetical protein